MPILRSLKSRVVWATSAALLAVMMIGGLVIHSVVTHRLRTQFDNALADKLRFFEATCFVKESGNIALSMQINEWENLQDPADPDYFQFSFANGKRIYKSRNLLESNLPATVPTGNGNSTCTGPDHGSVQLPGGRIGRFATSSFHPPIRVDGTIRGDSHDDPVLVTVAQDATMLVAASKELGTVMTVVGIFMALVIVAVTWFATHTGLRPLVSLRAQIDSTSVGHFENFTSDGLPEELEPVVSRLNALMERASSTLRHEREFTANIAHELRTPLAVMRSQLESILRKSTLPIESEDCVREALSTEGELERAVENLLWLARLDRGLDRFESQSVEFGRFMRKCWMPFLAPADAKGLQVEWDLKKAPTLACSPDLLRILLRNLYENAVAYSPHSGKITISGTNGGAPPSICVTNSCSGISREQLNTMFARADQRPARTTTESNLMEHQPARLGIGLALSRRVATILGGELTATLKRSNEIEFRLQLAVPTTSPFTNDSASPHYYSPVAI
ncbi:MAG: signal transduction histidine kinase [Verrucomicrobiales bacterium]|jgi:signal transduction histidine kinase